MATGEVDLVVVGADRIAANGDVANKIGTYPLAVLAHHHGVPFVVAAPRSTIDLATPDGAAIVVEDRPEDEVLTVGGVPTAPTGAPRRIRRSTSRPPARARHRHRARCGHAAVGHRSPHSRQRKGPRVILAPKCSDSSGPVSLRSDSSARATGFRGTRRPPLPPLGWDAPHFGLGVGPGSVRVLARVLRRLLVLASPTEASGPSSDSPLRSPCGSSTALPGPCLRTFGKRALYGRVHARSRRISRGLRGFSRTSSKRFVAAALDEIPRARREMENVAVVVEDWPPRGSRLLGLYEGVPPDKRGRSATRA